MADTLKILGQLGPAATTLGTLYTVPGATSTSVASIIACNRDATAATFRVSLAAGGAALGSTQYIYFDTALPSNDTFIATVGVTLAATDELRVFASHGSVTFTAVGVEVT